MKQSTRPEIHQDEQGRQVVVRNGYFYLPEHTITTGVGEVDIQVPKVRARSDSGIKVTSQLLPPYLKRARSVEELLPWLYLKGGLYLGGWHLFQHSGR